MALLRKVLAVSLLPLSVYVVLKLPYNVPAFVLALYILKVTLRLLILPMLVELGVLILRQIVYLLLPLGFDAMYSEAPVPEPILENPLLGYHTAPCRFLHPSTVAFIVAMAYTFLKNSLPAVAVEGRLVPY